MSITEFSIKNNRITLVILLLIVFSGIQAFINLPQQEDPGFIIRVAMVQTFFPGASSQRVEELVTDPIEEIVQEIPELKYVSSTSRTGASFVIVEIGAEYSDLRPIWDNLRRKMDAVRRELPEGAIGPFVNDEFGEVFGIVYTITGEGYNYYELKEVADQVRDEMLRVDFVSKVEIFGEQDERIFIEYNNARLSQLGLSPNQLQQILASQNILYPGGNIVIGDERIALEPTGNYEDLEELKKTVIAVPGRSEVLYLEDIANIERGYIDPPSSKMHSNGQPALALAISMKAGGNIIEMGEDVDGLIRQLQQRYPIGIEFDKLVFQPAQVSKKVDGFVNSLLQAIAIVIVVMLISLGMRTGLVVAALIPMTILMSFMLMNSFGITLNTISLAALIIALGMLVDNAIVMTESILVLMQSGKKPLTAAIEAAKELRIPLLTSSLTTAAAFLPIVLAESDVGEYTADLFKVVTIALMSSWILALTMIPMLAVIFIKVKEQKKDEGQVYNSRFYKSYRKILLGILRHRALTMAGVILLFVGGMSLGRYIPNLFFPKSDRAFMWAELNFPQGTPIDKTEAMIDDLEKFIADSLTANETRPEGIINWGVFIGEAPPRYVLSASSPNQSEGLAYLMANTTSRAIVDDFMPVIEKFLYDRYPDIDAIINPLDLGPPVEAPVQVRVYGQDIDQLFANVEEVKQLLASIPGTKNISDDWGMYSKKLIVDIDQPRARRAGVSSFDIATSLQTILEGIRITNYRENEDEIPVILRAEQADREDLAKLETLDVFSQSTGRSVPLKQVADIHVEWEPSKILRRDRTKMVTVKAYNAEGFTAMDLYNVLMPPMDEMAKGWDIGYYHEYGGELESSIDAQAAIGAKLPIAFGIILLLLVSQFNSLRRPLIIILTIPLALIGVNIGLLLLGGNMGFMTFLGVISLAGIVINNAIVLLDRIKIEIEEHGREPQRAIIEAAQTRIRPILLTTATTIGGLLPLYFGGDPMWVSMAIAIMFGLAFSTILTLGFVPVMYSLLFKVKYKGFKF